MSDHPVVEPPSRVLRDIRAILEELHWDEDEGITFRPDSNGTDWKMWLDRIRTLYLGVEFGLSWGDDE